MIIVNMNGQLGNQMFQYALYRKLQLQGKNVKFDMRYYDKYPQHNSINIFDLPLQIASTKEIHIERDEYRTYLDRIRRKLLGKRHSIISEIGEKSYNYNPDVFMLKRGYIDGYWQSEKYIIDIRDILLNEFVFPISSNILNIEIEQLIKNTISVSLHVRRGDYTNGFPLLDSKYYEEAIAFFQQKYNQVHFFVFSNDVEWCYQHLKADFLHFVDWNQKLETYYDMYLMTQCRHNIIANSTYSWWGAWLNKNMNQEVIAPSLWFYHANTPDIHCANWLVI